jgi:hypothetical protein
VYRTAWLGCEELFRDKSIVAEMLPPSPDLIEHTAQALRHILGDTL